MLGRISGLDKAVPRVALAESSSPLLEAAFTVLAVEGSGVGLAMVLRFNNPSNTKLRARTLSSATPKQALRAVPSTLTNVANSTGSKQFPTALSYSLFLLLFGPFLLLLIRLSVSCLLLISVPRLFLLSS